MEYHLLLSHREYQPRINNLNRTPYINVLRQQKLDGGLWTGGDGGRYHTTNIMVLNGWQILYDLVRLLIYFILCLRLWNIWIWWFFMGVLEKVKKRTQFIRGPILNWKAQLHYVLAKSGRTWNKSGFLMLSAGPLFFIKKRNKSSAIFRGRFYFLSVTVSSSAFSSPCSFFSSPKTFIILKHINSIYFLCRHHSRKTYIIKMLALPPRDVSIHSKCAHMCDSFQNPWSM